MEQRLLKKLHTQKQVKMMKIKKRRKSKKFSHRQSCHNLTNKLHIIKNREDSNNKKGCDSHAIFTYLTVIFHCLLYFLTKEKIMTWALHSFLLLLSSIFLNDMQLVYEIMIWVSMEKPFAFPSFLSLHHFNLLLGVKLC